jgi:sugar phosphate isomerase/epimerase
MFKIGTLADWFGLGIIEGIRESQRCGAQGVQLYAWKDFDPRSMKRDLLNQVRDTAGECEQEVCALCGELGGHGFEIAADNPDKVDYLKRVVDLALQLNCKTVTTHIGVIPVANESEKYKTMLDASRQIGGYAAPLGVTIAIETGPEPVARLTEFAAKCSGIGVNYDPANLVMVTKDDEVAGVKTAGKLIVHTHAKDGKCNHYVGPEEVYGLFAQGGIEALQKAQGYFTETPLGEGEVRWDAYLHALKESGYRGFLTIEREVKENAGEDIRKAVGFLREQLKKID